MSEVHTVVATEIDRQHILEWVVSSCRPQSTHCKACSCTHSSLLSLLVMFPLDGEPMIRPVNVTLLMSLAMSVEREPVGGVVG